VIKAEVNAGRIAHSRISKRCRFIRDVVVRTLADRAAAGGERGSRASQ
jgi:hypothetical protein